VRLLRNDNPVGVAVQDAVLRCKGSERSSYRCVVVEGDVTCNATGTGREWSDNVGRPASIGLLDRLYLGTIGFRLAVQGATLNPEEGDYQTGGFLQKIVVIGAQ
jgi:hypothetical protein